MLRRMALGVAVLTSACGDGSGPPLFPADYAATFQEVRNCRHSLDHDLMTIRVLASPDAVAPYTSRAAPFPTGAIVLKEQYDENDATCADSIVNYTVIKKLATGSSPATLDWDWQKVDANLNVIDTDTKSCINCHSSCGQPPDGYDGTCTVP